MKLKLQVVSYLLILLCVFTISCAVQGQGWMVDYEALTPDGCKTVLYKKVLSDRVEYKEVITCPNRPTATRTWTEYN